MLLSTLCNQPMLNHPMWRPLHSVCKVTKHYLHCELRKTLFISFQHEKEILTLKKGHLTSGINLTSKNFFSITILFLGCHEGEYCEENDFSEYLEWDIEIKNNKISEVKTLNNPKAMIRALTFSPRQVYKLSFSTRDPCEIA